MDRWLHRSQQDLQSASHVLGASPPLTATAVFHAQQAAEKPLKALLAAYDQPLARTHDLPRLVKQCQALDPDIE
jgi:HEPN domain-containing protein